MITVGQKTKLGIIERDIQSLYWQDKVTQNEMTRATETLKSIIASDDGFAAYHMIKHYNEDKSVLEVIKLIASGISNIINA
jgi:hypothetical protein